MTNWNESPFIYLFISLREFFLQLGNCDKLLVAGLTGTVLGLGVACLPYFDVVYASDKATFGLPYTSLGQGTEGALHLTFCTSSQLVIRKSFNFFNWNFNLVPFIHLTFWTVFVLWWCVICPQTEYVKKETKKDSGRKGLSSWFWIYALFLWRQCFIH